MSKLIAVIGDPHIGPSGKKVLPDGRNARMVDLIESLRRCVYSAVDNGASTIVIAGDIFDRSTPTNAEVVAVRNILWDVPGTVVVFPGNHDMQRSAAGKSPVALLDIKSRDVNVALQPMCVDIDGAALYCLPYPCKHWAGVGMADYASASIEEIDFRIGEHIKNILRGWAENAPDGEPSMLVGHIALDIAEAGGHRTLMADKDITIGLQDIPEEFNLSVFGHIHQHQSFKAFGRPNVLYAGSCDRQNFGEENEPKGYVLCDIESGTWEFIEIPCRTWTTFNITWAGDEETPNRWVMNRGIAENAICRVKVYRPEHVKPDLIKIEKSIRSQCFDFKGFEQTVDKVAAVRCKEVRDSITLDDQIRLWHEAKQCPVPLGELLGTAEQLEQEAANI